jgi:hypothetical protein
MAQKWAKSGGAGATWTRSNKHIFSLIYNSFGDMDAFGDFGDIEAMFAMFQAEDEDLQPV